MTPILSVENLSVDYKTNQGVVHALRNVSISLGEGEVLGIVGESGSGKSTLALAIARLLDPREASYKSGLVNFLGTELTGADPEAVQKMRGTGLFMVFQDPFMSLNPVMNVGDQIIEAVAVNWSRSSKKFDEKEASEVAKETLRSVNVGDADDVMTRYPHQLSGGQNQRVMIAMALAESPKLLIADEPTTALDVTTQGQVIALLREIVDRTKLSLLYITHDLAVAGSLCDRIAVMYAGMIQEIGPEEEILQRPEHPYTTGLIRSIPSRSKRQGPLTAIAGSFEWKDIAGKCAFAPRCELVHDACFKGVPALIQRDNSRLVRCVNYGESYCSS